MKFTEGQLKKMNAAKSAVLPYKQGSYMTKVDMRIDTLAVQT